MTTSIRSFAAAALVAACALPAAGQQAAKREQFLITKAGDTVAVELFTRDAKTLSCEIYQKNGPRTQYTMDLRPDSTISHVELTRVGQQGNAVGLSVFFLDGLVKAQMSAQGETQQFELPSRNAVPMLVTSFALCEQIIRTAHLGVGKSATFLAVRLAAADSATVTLTRFHADTVLFAMQGAQLKVALGSKGEVVGGLHLTQGWTITRKPAA
jgi:hypothetical protein